MDYSISALSAFHVTGDDRNHRLELWSVATQTDSPARPPRPPQSRCRASRVNLKSRHLALSQFKKTNRKTMFSMIVNMLLHSNLHGEGCCYLHIGLQSLLEHIWELLARPCDVRLCP